MLNRFQLKFLMLILMLLDHIAYFIPSAPQWFHLVGRVVAPVFFYLLVEGYLYTKNKSKYNKRLLIAAQIMFLGNTILSFILPKTVNDKWQVLDIGKRVESSLIEYIVLACIITITIVSIYYVCKQKELRNKVALIMAFLLVLSNLVLRNLFKGQFLFINNIFLSMAFSLSMLRGIDSYKETKNSKGAALAGLAFSFSAFTEALTIGPLMVLIFYFFKKEKVKMAIYYVLLSSIFLFGISGKAMINDPQWLMVFAIIFIFLYNGKKGKDLRYLFYIFYPVHIWLLYIISYFFT